MIRIALVLALMFTVVASTANAQKPVAGLLGNYSTMLSESLESVRRFCRYHGGTLVEGEIESEYECHKGNNKTGRGVILTFAFVNAYGSYEVLGIKVGGVLSRAAGVNAYEWIRRTNPWDQDTACKAAGHVRKCRRLYHKLSTPSTFREHRLDFYWHSDGNIIVNGALVLGLK